MLAARAERRVAAWELDDCLKTIEATDYQDIEHYRGTDDPDDPRRADFRDLAERVTTDVLIGRRHTQQAAEREVAPIRHEHREGQASGGEPFPGYYSFSPPWWERELRAWGMEMAPAAARSARPAGASGIAAAAGGRGPQDHQEDRPGGARARAAVKLTFPCDVTLAGTLRSHWVTLKGPEPQLDLFTEAPPASGTQRLQRLFELAQTLASKAECSEKAASASCSVTSPCRMSPSLR